MPPSAIPSSVRRVISSSPRRSRNSSTGAGGNFGARPQPPQLRVEARARARAARRRAARRSAARPTAAGARSSGCARSSFAPERSTSSRWSRHASATASSTCLNDGRPCRGSGGKYVPPKNGSPVRRQEDGHRPAAAAGQRDDGVHVDRVEVGPLLAVDLDADEVLVHHARGQRRPRTTRAPSRGTSGTRRSRSRAGSAGPRRARGRAPRRPTGTSRPGCPRAAGGTATSRAARRFTRATGGRPRRRA